MFDHVSIRVSDLEASWRFYDLASRPANFFVRDGTPFTSGLHVAFAVPDREAVDAWWERLTAEGYTSDGEPGPRPEYHERYYGAFVLDPDGNSVEAVHHHARVPGGIDHLWLRTRDVAAQKRFYETIAPAVGLRVSLDTPERVRFTDGTASFSFVAGDEATGPVHIAFLAPDHETVEEFHRLGTAAGYTDNGGPGERPQYHPGYYGAFIIDPDGHNIEAVHDGALRSQ